ncbi:DUF6241 domain-containing protein [Mesobacillus sp. S13]|uniref:DUF6241 domain-containing protein n=1 Tax=Mesobacillus sp. S13 TaxID=2880221 RepID=UPI001CF2E754|nr:DUF6241 domain-containing protein [Mesobacillus sp. S13]
MKRVKFLLKNQIVQIILAILSLSIVLSALVYTFIAPVYFSDETIQHKIVKQVQKEERQRANRKISSPNGEKLFNEEMTDAQVKKAIHLLSHQKVKAVEKWGAEEITQEKIDLLLQVVEGSSFYNRDLYLRILTAWAKGDFSRADLDHNAVWELQEGTVGRATGLLTPEEENLFIEENF